MDVSERLYEYIKEHFCIGEDPDFNYDVHLFDFGFVDSLGATEIILFLEDEFNVEITQKDIILYPMNTVNEITEVIKNKL